MSKHFDYLIAGAGISGLVMAERLCNRYGRSCLVVERRAHIGGNCYDEKSREGLLTHRYGPHYFRTNSASVRNYLSRFTEWIPVNYQIQSWTHGRYWNFPVNLNTYEQLVGRAATEAEFTDYLARSRVPITNPRNSEEVIISQVGWELFEMFFRGYTLKQWRREPKDLDASVCGRIPIRTNRDDRYLREDFQALPSLGYTRMFERMLEASPLVQVQLGADYREVARDISYRHLIFTGPIDEYFDCRLGALPYRSLRFEREDLSAAQLKEREAISGRTGFWQPALQVNYPNDHEYTRIVELKHATGQSCPGSTIVREYPADYGPGQEPYYPVPTAASQTLYNQYEALAAQEEHVTFVGRLATYRYYNMDQIVELALANAERLGARLLAEPTARSSSRSSIAA